MVCRNLCCAHAVLIFWSEYSWAIVSFVSYRLMEITGYSAALLARLQFVNSLRSGTGSLVVSGTDSFLAGPLSNRAVLVIFLAGWSGTCDIPRWFFRVIRFYCCFLAMYVVLRVYFVSHLCV